MSRTDFYSVVDSLSNLLHPWGTIGVCDFYGNAWSIDDT